MTPTRKTEDIEREIENAINPSPILSISALMQLLLHGHDMNAQFSEALSYDKKSQSMQLSTGKMTVLTIHFDSPAKHHLKSRANSNLEPKSTSFKVDSTTDTNEPKQSYELQNSSVHR